MVVVSGAKAGEGSTTRGADKNQGMSHEKILIVEDEENERTGLAELVSSWGYRAETARDGVEGLEKAAQWTPVHRDHRPQDAAHGRHRTAANGWRSRRKPWP